MKTYPSVSVIIPTKNEEENIVRCVKSVQKQDYKGKLEIILVDNYSTDKTVERAKPYVTKVIIKGPERSPQRNSGARAAHGQWLFFLDADMELSRDVIKECVELAQGKVATPIIAVSEESIGYTFWGKALALERNCYKNATWLHAARFFPRSSFLKLGGYDEHLVAGEDWDLTQRFRLKGFPLFVTKQARLFHYERKGTLRELFKKEYYYIQNIDHYAKKHPYPFSYQGSFLYRGFIWIRSWNELVRHPFLTSAFLWYKFVVWIMWMRHRRSVQG